MMYHYDDHHTECINAAIAITKICLDGSSTLANLGNAWFLFAVAYHTLVWKEVIYCTTSVDKSISTAILWSLLSFFIFCDEAVWRRRLQV